MAHQAIGRDDGMAHQEIGRDDETTHQEIGRDDGASMSQSRDRPDRRRVSSEDENIVEHQDLIDPSIIRAPPSGERWSIVVHCKGADGESQRIIQATLDRVDISFRNLSGFKDQLGARPFYKDETVVTYREWLRVHGHLNEIMRYKMEAERAERMPVQEDNNASNETEDTNWPSHARKIKKKKAGGKKDGRGTMKAMTALAKQSKGIADLSADKLKIEFSANLGGPCGENRRVFVDEITWVTRLHTPLIGVKH
ncbi:hypothetical protein QOZ80_6BG0477410 [Eleusine coracana subsp. coracana]|nr:hypothetical protein QOZ80_6BG0477410 [Eleusine coracana subsp. coracana]